MVRKSIFRLLVVLAGVGAFYLGQCIGGINVADGVVFKQGKAVSESIDSSKMMESYCSFVQNRYRIAREVPSLDRECVIGMENVWREGYTAGYIAGVEAERSPYYR